MWYTNTALKRAPAGVAELADARDLKSREVYPSYRFEPGFRHHISRSGAAWLARRAHNPEVRRFKSPLRTQKNKGHRLVSFVFSYDETDLSRVTDGGGQGLAKGKQSGGLFLGAQSEAAMPRGRKTQGKDVAAVSLRAGQKKEAITFRLWLLFSFRKKQEGVEPQ